MLAWFNSSLRIKSPFFAIAEIEPKFAMYPVGKIKLFCCDLCLDRIFSSFLYDSSFPETNLELD